MRHLLSHQRITTIQPAKNTRAGPTTTTPRWPRRAGGLASTKNLNKLLSARGEGTVNYHMFLAECKCMLIMSSDCFQIAVAERGAPQVLVFAFALTFQYRQDKQGLAVLGSG